jgi:carbon monoxide dehydrogenase subunit G
MSKYESSIQQIPYSQEAVYRNISDLNNLEKVRDRIPADKVNDFKFDSDSISINVSPVGDVKLNIVEREEPKCVKFEAAKSPVPLKVWIQVLPVTETSSKMKVTIDADIPFMLKGMVSGPLQDALEKVADALAMIRYEE